MNKEICQEEKSENIVFLIEKELKMFKINTPFKIGGYN